MNESVISCPICKTTAGGLLALTDHIKADHRAHEVDLKIWSGGFVFMTISWNIARVTQ